MSKLDWGEYKELSQELKEREDFITIRDIKKSLDALRLANAREHCELKEHAIKTNGRVNKLELWRAMIVGALIILGVIFPYLTFAN